MKNNYDKTTNKQMLFIVSFLFDRYFNNDVCFLEYVYRLCRKELEEAGFVARKQEKLKTKCEFKDVSK